MLEIKLRNEMTMLKQVLNHVEIPIIFIDSQHVVRYLNKAALSLCCSECTSESLVGMDLFSVQTSAGISVVQEGIQYFFMPELTPRNEKRLIKQVLDRLEIPIVFIDDMHVIRYLNDFAREEYSHRLLLGDLVGKDLLSLFDIETIPTILTGMVALQEGAEEVYLYYDKTMNSDVFLRAVRDDSGELVGSYYRFSNLKPLCRLYQDAM